jgi:outer membrane protein assembly factor BamB
MHRLLAGLVVSLAVPPSLPAADWYQFRGPTAQGHADSKNLPTEWSPTKNVAWRTEIPGLGWSSPVVAAGKVFLTTAVQDGDQLSLRALRLDAKTGHIDWNVEVFKTARKDAGPAHGKNSYASPTPIVEAGRVYVHFGHLGTACLNTSDGSKVWANRDLKYSPVHGNGGSPAIAGDKLILSIDGTDRQEVVALDKATGQVAWRTPRDAKPGKGFSFGTPLVITVNGREQVISQGSNVVMALDPQTGKEVWRVRYDGYSVVPRPVFGHGLVYAATGYDNPGLYAIRPDGTGDVTDSHVAWTVKKNAMPRNASPLLIGDALYVVSDGGLVTCLDANTGKERWNENLARPHSASPVYAGGRVYLLAEDATGTVFAPGSSYDPVATNKFAEKGGAAKYQSLASYAVDGDALLMRTAKALYRIEKK